jgi:hypothetical protein
MIPFLLQLAAPHALRPHAHGRMPGSLLLEKRKPLALDKSGTPVTSTARPKNKTISMRFLLVLVTAVLVIVSANPEGTFKGSAFPEKAPSGTPTLPFVLEIMKGAPGNLTVTIDGHTYPPVNGAAMKSTFLGDGQSFYIGASTFPPITLKYWCNADQNVLNGEVAFTDSASPLSYMFSGTTQQ